MARCRIIAFYLPQYHPIPENDAWWGKGSTEWTITKKAEPLFRGHRQPNLPAELGFYDLREPEARAAQAELARAHGIEGFCYWHYWYAGKRLLELPFNEVLRSGEPDFPFCLAWANHSWTGSWHRAPKRMLMEQTYPGPKDEEAHFAVLLEAFRDRRYIRVDGKPLVVIVRPFELPEPKRMTDHWRELAERAGLAGLYLVGNAWSNDWNPIENGFDASVVFGMNHARSSLKKSAGTFTRLFHLARNLALKVNPEAEVPVERYLYSEFIEHALPPLSTEFTQYPCAIPNWDNTPRAGTSGVVLHRSTPELFREHLKEAIAQVAHREKEHRIIFIRSWNEWGEGNYLEPDRRWGRAYLEAIEEEAADSPPRHRCRCSLRE